MDEIDEIEYYCECLSYCGLKIKLSYETAKKIREAQLIAIVDGCPHGAEPTDRLVESRQGYKLYRETRETEGIE